MAAKKIPDTLVGEVLARSANGEGTRKIAAWLEAEHGISIHFSSIADMVRDARAERKEAAQAIIAEKLGSAEGLSADIDGIIQLRNEAAEVKALCLEKVRAFPDNKTVAAWAAATREYREAVKLGLEVAGLSKPDESSAITDAAERVSGRIASLVAAAGAGASPSESEPN